MAWSFECYHRNTEETGGSYWWGCYAQSKSTPIKYACGLLIGEYLKTEKLSHFCIWWLWTVLPMCHPFVALEVWKKFQNFKVTTYENVALLAISV